ncbi:YciY family protein [Proteus mirabilis]|nr:YciY family protein [Proteus mirabilis]MBG6011697.1 YciY family protein [Proteus mirabilis]
MRHSRNEVARWRMMRQALRRCRRWLEGQSRRNLRIYQMRKLDTSRKHRALLFVQYTELN